MTTQIKPGYFPIKTTFGLDDVDPRAMALGLTPHSHPNIPDVSSNYVFRREPLRELNAFLMLPERSGLFISGPTGSGKTSIVLETLGRLNWPVQSITCHGRLEFQDLVGQFKLVKQAQDEAPTMQFVHGVLPTAMRDGHVLLLNEIDYCDPAEISGLNDILDGRSLVIPENNGEVIKPHPMFRIIATGNSTGDGDESGLFRGILAQNMAFMDRWRMSVVGYIDPASELKLLKARHQNVPEQWLSRLIEVANAIRRSFVGNPAGDQSSQDRLQVTMSTRVLLSWVHLMATFRDHPTATAYSLSLALTNRASARDREVIEKIAHSILGDDWKVSATSDASQSASQAA